MSDVFDSEYIRKKKVPFLFSYETVYDISVGEKLLLARYFLILSQGYAFPKHDFYSYCALLIKYFDKEISIHFKRSIEHIPEVRFELINFQMLNGDEVSVPNLHFYFTKKRDLIKIRKTVIRDQIKTTGVSQRIINNISEKNSDFYRRLLTLTDDFRDITLLDWFIPIVLSYERLIHIFIRHVEETKFAKGSFKRRSFFDYEADEIWNLLKMIIHIDSQNIKDHFLLNAVNLKLNKSLKKYIRNYKNPIIFDGDKFVLAIDENGFIEQFYQLDN